MESKIELRGFYPKYMEITEVEKTDGELHIEMESVTANVMMSAFLRMNPDASGIAVRMFRYMQIKLTTRWLSIMVWLYSLQELESPKISQKLKVQLEILKHG